MRIYLYGLVDPSSILPDTKDMIGVTGGVDIFCHDHGFLVFGKCEYTEVMPKRKFMLAHTRVLERLEGFATVLPMRFGMIAENLDRVLELISENNSVIDRYFSRLRDLREFGVKVAIKESVFFERQIFRDETLRRERDLLLKSKGGDHYAKANFGGKIEAAMDRDRTNMQKQVLKCLKPVVSDAVVHVPESEFMVVNCSVLIRQNTIEDLESRLRSFFENLEIDFENGVNVKIVGPVPMYNFVNLNLNPGMVDA